MILEHYLILLLKSKKRMNKIMQLKLLQLFVLIAFLIGATSCKKNKKLSELSDPQAEKEKMEEEMTKTEESTEEEPAPPLIEPILKRSDEQQLNNYFTSIANASSTTAANSSIQEALGMFSSPDAPLLIVFYEANGKASYDEPTTIEKYLNYLKDTGNAKAKVEEIVKDGNGKIKEIVLKK